MPTGDQEVTGSITAGFGKVLSMRLIMKYFLCVVILQLPLILEGKMSVSSEGMCTLLINR